MVVAFFTDLDETNLAGKMIDDLLVAAAGPPFDCVIIFAAGNDYPKWTFVTECLSYL